MNYALIENGVVTNVIWLYPDNEAAFPNAIRIDEGRPVAIGDTYVEGRFYRDGAEVLTPDEATILELDSALLDAEYENLTGGLDL